VTRIVDGLSTESRKIAARTMPSNHANAGLLIRRGLYDNLHSFAELEQRISALGDENSKAVGDAFEVFVEGYLATHQKLQAEAGDHRSSRGSGPAVPDEVLAATGLGWVGPPDVRQRLPS
jgi:hypothetical protein